MLTATPTLSCSNCNQELREDHKNYDYCPSCKHPFQPLLGRYRLGAKLTEGGFGQIYVAQDEVENRDCIVKVIRTDLLGTNELSLRFLREIRVTKELSEASDYIVRLYDCGQEPNLGHFYVMEHLYGETLHQRMKRKPLTFREVFSILRQLCEGMAVAHERHIVHRDLKPSNLFLSAETAPLPFLKILDFGIAKSLEGTLNHNLTQGMLGTPKYMSPEQFDIQEVGTSSDIYVIGLIAYELLTGTPLFTVEGESMAAFMNLVYMHHYEPPEPPSQRRPELGFSPELDEALLVALAKEPKDRYTTTTEMWEALEPFSTLAGLVTPKVDDVAPVSSPSPVRLGTQTGEPVFKPTFSSTPTPPSFPSQQEMPFLPTLGASQSTPSLPQFVVEAPSRMSPPKVSELQTKATEPTTSLPLGFVLSLFVFLLAVGSYLVPPTFSNHRSTAKAPMARSLSTYKRKVKPIVRPKAPAERLNKPILRRLEPTPARKFVGQVGVTSRNIVVVRRAPSVRKTKPVIRRKVRRKVRRIRKVRRRVLPVRRRTAKRKVTPRSVVRAPTCGNIEQGWRWVQGSFTSPLVRRNVRVTFLSCRGCKSLRKGASLCLRLPQKQRVTLRVYADGFHTCRHNIAASSSRLQWKLLVYKLDDLVDETYPCHKETR